jgi:hypothetical protein
MTHYLPREPSIFNQILTDQATEIPMQTAKQAAWQIIEQVPEQASGDDIIYKLYVKRKIEKGIKAVEEDRFVSHDEAKNEYFHSPQHLET